jgi:integrase/recombinase XerD
MANNDREIIFQSTLAPLMAQFIEEKHACGYRYHSAVQLLANFDRFLAGETLSPGELPRPIIRKWLAKKPHESALTQQRRITIVRQFALFMCRLGYHAYVPDRSLATKNHTEFSPHILTQGEVEKILQAADHLPLTARSPLRHLIMPEVFRLLYGCGFRLNEVLQLRVRDVDLNHGILTVRQGKFGKDRLVPPALPLVLRLQKYAATFGIRPPEAFFFPSPQGGSWSIKTIYHIFRQLLLQCGISHAGRGKGPRVHDLRHTFAVQTLLRWYREDADLNAKLPVLATYLGHQSMKETQLYLHLTADMFPEIVIRANAEFGDIIPRRIAS